MAIILSFENPVSAGVVNHDGCRDLGGISLKDRVRSNVHGLQGPGHGTPDAAKVPVLLLIAMRRGCRTELATWMGLPATALPDLAVALLGQLSAVMTGEERREAEARFGKGLDAAIAAEATPRFTPALCRYPAFDGNVRRRVGMVYRGEHRTPGMTDTKLAQWRAPAFIQFPPVHWMASGRGGTGELNGMAVKLTGWHEVRLQIAACRRGRLSQPSMELPCEDVLPFVAEIVLAVRRMAPELEAPMRSRLTHTMLTGERPTAPKRAHQAVPEMVDVDDLLPVHLPHR